VSSYQGCYVITDARLRQVYNFILSSAALDSPSFSTLASTFSMASPSELDIINSNPIKNGLSTFRRLFESARAKLGVADSPDALQAIFSTAPAGTRQPLLPMEPLLIFAAAKNLLLELVLALQNEPAARLLPSRIADRTLSADLTILYSRIDSNHLGAVLAIPLVEL
jgi:hypothetical protein